MNQLVLNNFISLISDFKGVMGIIPALDMSTPTYIYKTTEVGYETPIISNTWCN